MNDQKVVVVHIITDTGSHIVFGTGSDTWASASKFASDTWASASKFAYRNRNYVVVQDAATGKISALDGRGPDQWTGWHDFASIDAAVLAGRIMR